MELTIKQNEKLTELNDRYYDYHKALEKLENDKGFLHSSKEIIINYKSQDIHIESKKPNVKFAIIFLTLSIFIPRPSRTLAILSKSFLIN